MRTDPRELGAIFAGGALGAIARAEVEQALPAAAGSWPWATVIVNVLGACLLGYVAARQRGNPTYLQPLIGTGFCGGLTTFSTMQLELLRMLDAGRVGLAAGYIAVSVAAGFAGVTLGSRAGLGAVPEVAR